MRRKWRRSSSRLALSEGDSLSLSLARKRRTGRAAGPHAARRPQLFEKAAGRYFDGTSCSLVLLCLPTRLRVVTLLLCRLRVRLAAAWRAARHLAAWRAPTAAGLSGRAPKWAPAVRISRARSRRPQSARRSCDLEAAAHLSSSSSLWSSTSNSCRPSPRRARCFCRSALRFRRNRLCL